MSRKKAAMPQKGAKEMNLVSSVASYGILLICFVAVAAVGVFVGILMRKRKDSKEMEGKEN